MDVKYQVFISSTFEDLKDERRAVIEAVLNLDHIPVGMEAFQAGDDTQWDYIKRRIDESDYYVVIVAERYGSELKGKSYTQMEYEYAVAQGVPVAAFLLDTTVRKSWPSDRVEFDKKEKVEKFRKLCQKKLVKHWRNADDLGGKVSAALSGLIHQKPRTGWVRADNLPSARVLEEIAILSEEKRRLQEDLLRFSDNNTLKIPDHAIWRLKDFKETEMNTLFEITNELGSLLSAYVFMAQFLVVGCALSDVKAHLEDFINIVVELEDAERFINRLLQNNLLTLNDMWANDPSSLEGKRISLSEYGKEFLMYAREWAPELRD